MVRIQTQASPATQSRALGGLFPSIINRARVNGRISMAGTACSLLSRRSACVCTSMDVYK